MYVIPSSLLQPSSSFSLLYRKSKSHAMETSVLSFSLSLSLIVAIAPKSQSGPFKNSSFPIKQTNHKANTSVKNVFKSNVKIHSKLVSMVFMKLALLVFLYRENFQYFKFCSCLDSKQEVKLKNIYICELAFFSLKKKRG